MQKDLISRSALIEAFWDDIANGNQLRYEDTEELMKNAPAVDAVEVTGHDVQFLIDALYHHTRWMKAGGLDKPECGYDERISLLDRLMLFEREHFPDMKAETEV